MRASHVLAWRGDHGIRLHLHGRSILPQVGIHHLAIDRAQVLVPAVPSAVHLVDDVVFVVGGLGHAQHLVFQDNLAALVSPAAGPLLAGGSAAAAEQVLAVFDVYGLFPLEIVDDFGLNVAGAQQHVPGAAHTQEDVENVLVSVSLHLLPGKSQ